jgi:hypothetical protein
VSKPVARNSCLIYTKCPHLFFAVFFRIGNDEVLIFCWGIGPHGKIFGINAAMFLAALLKSLLQNGNILDQRSHILSVAGALDRFRTPRALTAPISPTSDVNLRRSDLPRSRGQHSRRFGRLDVHRSTESASGRVITRSKSPGWKNATYLCRHHPQACNA